MAYNNKYNKNYTNENEFSKESKIKEKIIKGGQNLKYLLKTTAIEAAILGVLWAGIWTYNWTKSESKRAEKIPLAFSEIEAVERQAARDNIKVGEISEYEMKINDMCMKIFEAYNQAQGNLPAKENELFATNIYNAMELKNIYKYNLKDLVTQVPDYIPQISNTLDKYKIIGNSLDVINDNMDKSWDDSHTDNYHTELQLKTTIDSKWNLRSKLRPVQVYDNTTHSYEYKKEYGEAWAKDLTELFTKIPTIKLEENILKSNETNAEGEYAAEKSRNMLPHERLTQEELLSIANTWYTGSTILENINNVESLYPKLNNSAIERVDATKTAQNETYKTTSRDDDGPKEFQIANNTLDLWIQINDNLKEMQKVITSTSIKVPLLEKKINEFIEVWYVKALSSQKEASKLADEIITLTKEIYKINFKKGLDMENFRWAMIFLYALIGFVIGWATGIWLNALDNKLNIYDKIKFSK